MPTLAVLRYLNTRPFYEAILRGRVRFPGTIREGTPREANRMLVSGEADLGILSALEWARHADDFLLLPEIVVASEGPVRSIRLYRLTKADPPRKVNATAESETAAALVAVLYPGVAIARFAPDDPALFENADAALLIGDDALADDRPHDDLGAVWTERTGLPFVWAVGVVRRDALARDPAGTTAAIRAWREAAARGEEMDEAIAASSQFPRDLVLPYLAALRSAARNPLRWDGLERFLGEAKRHGLLDRVPRFAFYHPSAVRVG